MNPVLLTLLFIAMAAVVAVLFAGLITMARGGSINAKYANLLMRWRVILQGIAVLIFIVAILAAA